jgi:AcrR family transcriptional regulator
MDLIEAVVRVIARSGIEATTTREIAAEAGAPLASLHYCFSSKEDLLFATFENLVTTLADATFHVRSGVGLGRAAASLLRQELEWYKTEAGYSKSQQEIMSWAYRQDPHHARRIYDRAISMVESRLRDGMRADDDEQLVKPLALMVSAAVDGIVVQSVFYGDDPELAEVIDTAAESLELLATAHRVDAAHATR